MIFYSYLDSVINVSNDLKTELAKIAKRKLLKKEKHLFKLERDAMIFILLKKVY